MPISLSCPNCGRSYQLKTKLAGRKIRCQDCSTVIQVPDDNRHEVEDYFGDDESSDHEWSAATRPPVHGGGRLPPRIRPGSTASAVSTSSPRKKKRRKPRVKLPVKKIIFGVVGLLIVAVVVKFGLDVSRKIQDRIAASQPDWRDYEVPGQPISILMPGLPQPVNEFRNGVLMRGATAELGKKIGDSGGVFFVLYGDHGFEDRKMFDVDDWFQWRKIGMTPTMMSSSSGIDESTISITDQGGNVHPGREYQLHQRVEGKEVKFIYRFYLVGYRAIIAATGVSSKHEQDFQARSTKFLDSLQITDSISSVTASQKAELQTIEQQPGRAQSGF